MPGLYTLSVKLFYFFTIIFAVFLLVQSCIKGSKRA